MGRKNTPRREQRVIADAAAFLDSDVGFQYSRAITGDELRQRIDDFGVSYTRAAFWLGLSVDGLYKQMRGDRAVSRQTMLLLHRIEEVKRNFSNRAAAAAYARNKRAS